MESSHLNIKERVAGTARDIRYDEAQLYDISPTDIPQGQFSFTKACTVAERIESLSRETRTLALPLSLISSTDEGK